MWAAASRGLRSQTEWKAKGRKQVTHLYFPLSASSSVRCEQAASCHHGQGKAHPCQDGLWPLTCDLKQIFTPLNVVSSGTVMRGVPNTPASPFLLAFSFPVFLPHLSFHPPPLFPLSPLSPSFLLYIYSCRVEWSQDRNNVRLCTVRNSPAGRACSQRSGARTDWASLFLLSNPAMPITWWQRGCSRQRRPRFQLRIPRLHPIRKLFFSERCFLPWKRDRTKRKEAWVLVPCWEQVRWFLCRHFVNGKYCKDADGRY